MSQDPIFRVCSLQLDHSLSTISFISPSKQQDYWNANLILLRYHFLPFWHSYKLIFSLLAPFPAGFLFLLSWADLLICHSRLQLLSSSHTLGHRTGTTLEQYKRQRKWFLSLIFLPENVQEKAMVGILPKPKIKEKKWIRNWKKMCNMGMWGLSVAAWALSRCSQ